jgi:hypothetical protein
MYQRGFLSSNTELFGVKQLRESVASYLLKPDIRSAARRVFATSIVMVIGPTLPVTSVPTFFRGGRPRPYPG